MQVDERLRLFVPLLSIALLQAGCAADETPRRSRTDGANPDFGNARSSTGSAGQPGGLGTDNPSGPARAPTAGVGAGEDTCAEISQTADNRLRPADIIFAVDNSGSMDEEIVFVREQLNAFSQQIVDSGIDVRIILISAPVSTEPPPPPSLFGDDDDDQDNGICIAPPLGSGNCPDDSNLPRYMHVQQEVKSHNALNLFVATFPQWQPQLRPNASKTFVVVTDDNAEDEPNDSAAGFSASVASLDPTQFAEWSFSGIYCFTECPEAAEIGTVYQDLVAQKSGVGGDLCLQDFAPVFDMLARQVIGTTGIDCSWDIPAPPQGQTLDTGRVNVQYRNAGVPQTLFHVDGADGCGTDGGWFYDQNAAPTKVLVCPATCDQLRSAEDAEVEVLFGCDTRNRPL